MVDESLGNFPKGARVPPAPFTAEDFDRAHGKSAGSALLWSLDDEAYGRDRPTELQAWGMTTWWTLGHMVSGLRLSPGEHLLDLACGRGGVGLWLARATASIVTGVDFSPAGIREAANRAPAFVPGGRAQFRVGDLADTGLEPASVDGAVCADAVFFAADRTAVFAEVARVLRPGGRFVFTATEEDTDRPTSVPDWAPIVELGGLQVICREEIPNWSEQLGAMYSSWLTNIDALRAELGDEADDLVAEAESVGPTLASRTGVLYVTEKS